VWSSYFSPSFYKSLEGEELQGLSLAACYPCEVQGIEGSFDISGTIVEEVQAEFISHQTDNDPDDGDGCELIIGILVDQQAPFTGATLPATEQLLRLGCLRFDIADDPSLCGSCLSVEFCDDINGRGTTPAFNLASVSNQSYPLQTSGCDLCVGASPVFHRGDCNYSLGGKMSVNIADAAAMVSFLFGPPGSKFEPPCMDACDCNDDGQIDLVDAICTLGFLFELGSFPPPPGPGFTPSGEPRPPGVDPTDDDLGCDAGATCDA